MKESVFPYTEENAGVFGYCRRCGEVHYLEGRSARIYAERLMESMEDSCRLDFQKVTTSTDSSCSTDALFGDARGKMFGVLLCRDESGGEIVLRAFSGQVNGRWSVPGWVDPLFSEELFHRCNDCREKEIKRIGHAMTELPPGCKEQQRLMHLRKKKSRQLMQDIFNLYRVPNFRGEECSLQKAFTGNGLPCGTGDCCAPKLLGHAARNNLKPVSLAEFYYGKENVSGSRRHKQFYPPCRARCQPILGYMLCGIKDL